MTYAHSTAGVGVTLPSGQASGGDAAVDVLSNIENVIGSSKNDFLFGSTAVNRLDGGAGDDWINGSAGGDVLIGGSGVDTVDYTGSNGAVRVDIAANTALLGHASGDQISGFENIYGTHYDDVLKGNSAGNWLWGDAGNDWLYGQGGNDMMRGMEGQDRMWGCTGADMFIFKTTAESGPGLANRDAILDFSRAEGDKIDLSAIDAISGGSTNEAFQFKGQQGFTAAGQVRFYFDGDNTVIEVNTVGAGGPEMELVLTGQHNLTAGDFIL